MRSLLRLTQAMVVALLLQATFTSADDDDLPSASLVFPQVTPQQWSDDVNPASDCTITSNPVVFASDSVMNSYVCGSGKNQYTYIGRYKKGARQIARHTPGNSTWAEPVPVGDLNYALTYTNTDASNGNYIFSVLRITESSVHAHSYGSIKGWPQSKPDYSTKHDQYFFTSGTSVRADHLYNHTEVASANIDKVDDISNIKYVEGLTQSSHIFWVSEEPNAKPYIYKMLVYKPVAAQSNLKSFNDELARGKKAAAEIAKTNPEDADKFEPNFPVRLGAIPNVFAAQKFDNPCGVAPAPGEHFQLEFLTFGYDKNGPLRGLFMYGNYDPKKTNPNSKFTRPNFMICRFSHHDPNNAKNTWGFSDAYTVYGVTAGDNATFWNVYNKDNKTYEILVLNQSTGVRSQIKTRTAADRNNNPRIMYGNTDSITQAVSPRLIFQQSRKASNPTEMVAIETWHAWPNGGEATYSSSIGPKGAWAKSDFLCTNTPAINHDGWNDGREVGFCNTATYATAFTFDGKQVWRQSGSFNTNTNPVRYGISSAIFQSQFSVVGYNVLPAAPPGPEEGSSVGKAFLVFFLILLFGGLIVGGLFFAKKKGLLDPKRRGAIPESNGGGLNEGYGAVHVADDTA